MSKGNYGIGHSSTVGLRQTMEDNFSIATNSDFSLFAIFDGHAGSNSSRLASEMITKEITKVISNDVTQFPKCFENIQMEVKSRKLFDGCTAAVTLIYNNICYIGSIGDSRILRIKKNGFQQMTNDQKASFKKEYKRLKSLNLGVTDGRVKGKLAVSRAIGDLWCGEELFSMPKIKSYEINADEIGLIVACDGVWDVLTNEDAYNIFMNAKSPQDAATSLKNAALANGSTDNISVIAVKFDVEEKYKGFGYCNEIERLQIVPEIESNEDMPFQKKNIKLGAPAVVRRKRR
ncbi:protein phosphatase 2C [Histomonas meleagridis]|uniref:protein phosphatase 2C n=1 Tax=Histomonas meleagridis TaxID=135588 RepID=UPI00355AB20D|nr:protein phosphatase 2C [Histomonas meleagridis]KAH0802300.1 protein phosphatase 2C [Histomonas meleagridis]